MERRKLGRSGLEIAPIVFGGNVFGWTADEATSFSLLDAFVASGFNCIDTADVYSRWVPGHQGGESETVIGDWLKRRGRRDDVIIATKVGGDMGEGVNLKRAYILKCAEASLKRLQTDYIDLYQAHWDDNDDAGRGDDGGVRDADRAGQGARDRRLEPDAGAAARFARGERQARLAALRVPAAALQSRRASRSTSGISRRCASSRGWASSPTGRWPPGS